MRRLAVLAALTAFGATAFATGFFGTSTRPWAPPAAAAGLPYMAIDADPTNGTRPCSPIDATRTGAPTNGTYKVAICLVGAAATPEVFAAYVTWTGDVAVAVEVPNADEGLADNPDFNESAPPFGFGPGWLCNAPLGEPVGNGYYQDTAQIVCSDRAPVHVDSLAANPGLLAMLTMRTTGPGTETFALHVASAVYTGTSERSCADILCPGASVAQDTVLAQTETPTPTWTPLPATPTATPCMVACPTLEPTATPDAQGVPHLAIDADPANGVRPCQPIDTTRADGPASGTYQVAFCLVNTQGTPDAWEARVSWSGGVAIGIDLPDVPPDALDDNPDFNNSPPPFGFGNAWSCPSIGTGYPRIIGGSASYIRCDNRLAYPYPTTLTASPGLLALLTVQATGFGTTTFSFSDTGDSAVNSPAGINWLCNMPYPDAVYCPGATVVQSVLPSPTPTRTPTPTATATPTATPTPTATHTRTPTATPTPKPAIVGGVGTFVDPVSPDNDGRNATAYAVGAAAAAMLVAGAGLYIRRRHRR